MKALYLLPLALLATGPASARALCSTLDSTLNSTLEAGCPKLRISSNLAYVAPQSYPANVRLGLGHRGVSAFRGTYGRGY